MTDWDERFLDLAAHIAQWSKDPSLKVGAVIVWPDHSIVSTGFNGFPKKMPDYATYYGDRDTKLSRIIHAEMNALLFARTNLTDCTLYTWPLLPCDRCSVHMIQSGIIRFVAPVMGKLAASRWGAAVVNTRHYAAECGVEVVEVG